MKILKFTKSNLLTLLLSIPFVFALIFIKSPISYNIGFSFLIYAPIYLILYFLLSFSRYDKKIDNFTIFFTLISLTTIFFVVIYQAKVEVLYSVGTILIGILIFSVVEHSLFIKIIQVSTIIVFILLLGSWITFFDAILTGLPESIYHLPQGREVYLGRLSLGSEMIGPDGNLYFRPSGIYDEPGAFSFVIVFLVAIRNTLNMKEKYSWAILLLGFITFSIAHLIFTFFYFLHKINIKKIFIFFSFMFLIIFLIRFLDSNFYDPIEAYFNRFTIVSAEEGYFRGNNRYNRFIEQFGLLKNLDIDEIFFGKPEIAWCCQPLEPLYLRGIFGSWPYYFIIFLFVIHGFRRKNIIFIAVVFMLLQRPEVQSAGSSFLVAALFFSRRFEKIKLFLK